MAYQIKSPRKLIEVALPLDKINEAAAREKSIRHGHPSTLHLWWARRPLAAARAVIFAQMVNDPGYQQGGGFKYGKNKKEAAEERKRLFRILEELVQWENTTNKRVLEEARAEIRRSWREVCELNRDHPDAAELFNPDRLPGLHDPFAGGGAIPLEAQRLGLEAFASDLNPVAVTINKAMIEIPPRFSGQSPVGPLPRGEGTSDLGLKRDWPGSTGLAEDVRRYGLWLRQEAFSRIGHLYPAVEITHKMATDRPDLVNCIGQKLTVIAWLWVRTVKSPNPAYSHVDIPLASTFVLSSKDGKEAFVEPIVHGEKYIFTVKTGKPSEQAISGTKSGKGNFRCLISDAPIDAKYIRSEAQQGRMKDRLLAIVVEGPNGRLYLPPTEDIENIARNAIPKWKPDQLVPTPCHDVDRLPMYGMKSWGDAFTPRQLVGLTTLSDLVGEVIDKVKYDSIKIGKVDDNISLSSGGSGVCAYAEAIGVYLAFLVDQESNQSSTFCGWNNINQQMIVTFSRQALSMVWDFAECNIFSQSTGSYWNLLERQVKGIISLTPESASGLAFQADARRQLLSKNKVVSTDPPYYDNIGYADLSDFFYVWLRKSLKKVYPDLYATIVVPKDEELIASPYRHKTKEAAEQYFLNGMKQVFHELVSQSHSAHPITIYYAYKQSETKNSLNTLNTGWDTFLQAVIDAGLVITATWPMKTESANKLKANVDALASSIILACRPRPLDALNISRREFLRELNSVLPGALDEMTKGTTDGHSPIAPVDLSQAIIGPGMAVFSKYSAVLEADGSPMPVRTALQLINRFLAEDDFDHDTQWCLHWFEQYGWKKAEFGQADVLARAKATSVDGLTQAGVVEAGGGQVRLLKWSEYPQDWDPRTDVRLPVWEALHQLIRSLKQGGETAAGAVVASIPAKMEAVRQLAYRLYTLCERQNWAEDARAYNELITSWSGIESAASNTQPAQRGLFD